jgi:hypothetical protein
LQKSRTRSREITFRLEDHRRCSAARQTTLRFATLKREEDAQCQFEQTAAELQASLESRQLTGSMKELGRLKKLCAVPWAQLFQEVSESGNRKTVQNLALGVLGLGRHIPTASSGTFAWLGRCLDWPKIVNARLNAQTLPLSSIMQNHARGTRKNLQSSLSEKMVASGRRSK